MILRAEKPSDFSEIAKLTYLAFLNWRKEDVCILEPEMIAIARQSTKFDPEMSIVAEDNGKIVGHILLMPSDYMMHGKIISGVVLGPISVLPELQKTGIGKKLMACAHLVPKEKGYECSLLCGHKECYPKFGSIQNTFSLSGTKIKRLNGSKSNMSLDVKARPITLDDVANISNWQMNIRKNEPLALLFENDLMGYHAFTKGKTGVMLEIDSMPIAYVKYNTLERDKINYMFFDENQTDSAIEFLFVNANTDVIEIGQPPLIYKQLLSTDKYSVSDERSSCDAFMILPLDKESIINDYCDMAYKDSKEMGVICFPSYCDVE